MGRRPKTQRMNNVLKPPTQLSLDMFSADTPLNSTQDPIANDNKDVASFTDADSADVVGDSSGNTSNNIQLGGQFVIQSVPTGTQIDPDKIVFKRRNPDDTYSSDRNPNGPSNSNGTDTTGSKPLSKRRRVQPDDGFKRIKNTMSTAEEALCEIPETQNTFLKSRFGLVHEWRYSETDAAEKTPWTQMRFYENENVNDQANENENENDQACVCWHCTFVLKKEWVPIPFPYEYDPRRERMRVVGLFCSMECAKAWGLVNQPNRLNRECFLQTLIKKWTGEKIKCKYALPKERLRRYGGHLEIDQYRQGFHHMVDE